MSLFQPSAFQPDLGQTQGPTLGASTVVLAAQEAEDIASFAVGLVQSLALTAVEAPDVASFTLDAIPSLQTLTLAAQESPDIAQFTMRGPDVQENTPGFLSPEAYKRLRKKQEDEERQEREQIEALSPKPEPSPKPAAKQEPKPSLEPQLVRAAERVAQVNQSTQAAAESLAAFIEAQKLAAMQAQQEANELEEADEMQAIALILSMID